MSEKPRDFRLENGHESLQRALIPFIYFPIPFFLLFFFLLEDSVSGRFSRGLPRKLLCGGKSCGEAGAKHAGACVRRVFACECEAARSV